MSKQIGLFEAGHCLDVGVDQVWRRRNGAASWGQNVSSEATQALPWP